MSDERFYAKVVEELRSSDPVPGLWAKAFAESQGDQSVAKALYLRLRASQLEAAELEEGLEAQRAADERAAQVAEEKMQSTISLWAKAAYPIILFVVAVVILGVVGRAFLPL